MCFGNKFSNVLRVFLVQAYFRGAKAALALKLIPEALSMAEKGLQIDPLNIELRKIGDKAKAIQDEEDAKKKRDLEALKGSEVSSKR